MDRSVLARLFEHNNWANRRIVEACSGLTDEQLDAAPASAALGSIRDTLLHLARAQAGYLSLLTTPVSERRRASPTFDELLATLEGSGEALLSLVEGLPDDAIEGRLETRDGYYVEPYVVLVQVINHATEHREQISSMLSSLGVTPPEMDGWSFGEATGALVPIAQGSTGGDP